MPYVIAYIIEEIIIVKFKLNNYMKSFKFKF